MFQFWHDFGWRLHRWLVRLCYPRTDGLTMLSRVAILLWTLSLASWVKTSGSSSSWVFNPDFSWVIQMSGLRRLNRILWSAGATDINFYTTTSRLICMLDLFSPEITAFRLVICPPRRLVWHRRIVVGDAETLVRQRLKYLFTIFFFEKIMLSISTPLN